MQASSGFVDSVLSRLVKDKNRPSSKKPIPTPDGGQIRREMDLVGRKRGLGLKESLTCTKEWEEIHKSPCFSQFEHSKDFRAVVEGGRGSDERGDQALPVSLTKGEEISKSKRYAIVESTLLHLLLFWIEPLLWRGFSMRGEKDLARVMRKMKGAGIFLKIR